MINQPKKTAGESIFKPCVIRGLAGAQEGRKLQNQADFHLLRDSSIISSSTKTFQIKDTISADSRFSS